MAAELAALAALTLYVTGLPAPHPIPGVTWPLLAVGATVIVLCRFYTGSSQRISFSISNVTYGFGVCCFPLYQVLLALMIASAVKHIIRRRPVGTMVMVQTAMNAINGTFIIVFVLGLCGYGTNLAEPRVWVALTVARDFSGVECQPRTSLPGNNPSPSRAATSRPRRTEPRSDPLWGPRSWFPWAALPPNGAPVR